MVKKISTSRFQKLMKKRYVRFYLVPFLLALCSFLLASFTALTLDARYSVLPANHFSDASVSPTEINLYKGKSIHGNFVAKENNLGSVAIRLKNYNIGNRDDGRKFIKEDEVIFRLKEKGSKQWYYQQQYSGGQFHELDYFPFGFPLITDSKNKTYVFEIVSMNGNDDNVLTLTSGGPILKTNYQFDKNSLLANSQSLIHFLTEKQIYAFATFDYYFMLFIFLLPLYLYFISISPFGRLISRPIFFAYKKMELLRSNKFLIVPFAQVTVYEVIVFIAVLMDIFLIHEEFALISVVLISMWIVRLLFSDLKSDISFTMAGILLFVGCVLFLFPTENWAEKNTIWIFYFILIGVIHGLIELRIWKNEK